MLPVHVWSHPASPTLHSNSWGEWWEVGCCGGPFHTAHHPGRYSRSLPLCPIRRKAHSIFLSHPKKPPNSSQKSNLWWPTQWPSALSTAPPTPGTLPKRAHTGKGDQRGTVAYCGVAAILKANTNYHKVKRPSHRQSGSLAPVRLPHSIGLITDDYPGPQLFFWQPGAAPSGSGCTEVGAILL